MLKKTAIILISILSVGTVGLLIYFSPNIYENFGTRYANADREIFKNTVTYNEGVIDDLAKYKFQYDTAEDDIERAAIADLVRSRFANFDKSKIENEELREFLEDCGV